MIITTPFHERTAARNETGLWRHWAGHLVVDRYLAADKREYYALRNAAGLLDTSPLYKYRIHGPDAEEFLARVLARDVRRCLPGRAQYTMWCDDRGFVVEDGVVLRVADAEYWLTSVEPNLAYLQGRAGYERVEIEDVSADFGILALQGPASPAVLRALDAAAAALPNFGVAPAKLGGAGVTVSRTGYTGDVGFEIWVDRTAALDVWDAVIDAGSGHGLLPYGSLVLHMARIEAGLVLLDVDYESSRHAWTDHQRATPLELGYGWMFADLDQDDRRFVGRAAIERARAEGASRWRLVGLDVDWREYERAHADAGLRAPKDHRPTEYAAAVHHDGAVVGHATGFMFSPLLQRHIAMARVPPPLATPDTAVGLEITVNHRPAVVGATTRRLPFFAPERRVASLQ